MQPCTLRYKVFVFFAFMAAYWVFYLYPNLFASWVPHQLPLLAIDRNTPFLPATFLIYMSDYWVFVFVIFLHQTRNDFHHVTRMCFATLFVCGLFFLLYPTTYPRPDYPVVTNPIVQFALDTITNVDSPRNCFPSMHVALTGVATYSLRKKARLLFFAFILWTLAIYVSTLTTKQHYFVDIVGGIGVMVVVAFVEFRFLSKQPWFFPNSEIA